MQLLDKNSKLMHSCIKIDYKPPLNLHVIVATYCRISPICAMRILENRETRDSLRSAFRSLFARYEREFYEDDEIDLATMTVTRPRGHLVRMAHAVPFGSMFPCTRAGLPGPYLGPSVAVERDDVDVFVGAGADDVDAKVSEHCTALQRSLRDAIAMSPQKQDHDHAQAEKKKRRIAKTAAKALHAARPQTFDEAIEMILAQDRAARACPCARGAKRCFDCALSYLASAL